MEFDFNNYLAQPSSVTPQAVKQYDVTFFSLPNDGDEAIVRFPYTSLSEFKTVVVHSVKQGNSYRKISCLRNAYDPIDTCPLCASGNNTQLRFFCKLVKYVPNPDGSMKAQACVWDRPMQFAEELKDYVQMYGASLPNMVFKIKRKGAKYSRDTVYTLSLPPAEIYPANIYVPDFSGFEKTTIENHFYFNKTADEIKTYLTTGNFPAVVREQKQNNAQTFTPQNQTFTPQSQMANVNVNQSQQNFANVDFINQAVQNTNQVFTPQTAQYTPPAMGVEQPITQEQLNAQANTVQQTVTKAGTSSRYVY